MASDDEKPLLNDRKCDPKRRRFRRCRSAPQAEFLPGAMCTNDDGKVSSSESFLDKIHPSFRKVAIYLIIYLTIGTVCFYFVKDEITGDKIDGVLDSVYFCIVTMTTVGYGDLVPNSAASKLLACAFVFSGMVLIGLTVSKGADYLVDKQEILLVKALHMNNKDCSTTEVLKETEDNKVRYKCFVTMTLFILLFIVGTVFLVTVEKLDLVDAVYCVCSTITTLGYGDKSFSTKAGRIFAIFWILMSTICLAQFLCYIAELNTESRQKALVKYVLTRKMTNVDLEAADVDKNGNVGAAEFVLYKLKEMGKISQDDISLLLEEFDHLDVDQSGTLSTSDLVLAQSTPTIP